MLMQQPDFSRVGFSHFGTGHTNPIPMLKDAIKDFKSTGGNIENALIVLPEAFNIGGTYYAPEPPNVDLSILGELSRLSTDSKCAFVAGLIIADTPDIFPPHSSAYLIDRCFQKRITRKEAQDDAEVGRVAGRGWSAKYTSCPSHESTPIQHRGLAIATLIRNDAQSGTLGPDEVYISRCDRVTSALRGFGCQYKVMCVPAHMSNGFWGGQVGQDATLAEPLKGTIHILANSCTSQVKSFVTNTNGVIVSSIGGSKNQIAVVSLETLCTETFRDLGNFG